MLINIQLYEINIVSMYKKICNYLLRLFSLHSALRGLAKSQRFAIAPLLNYVIFYATPKITGKITRDSVHVATEKFIFSLYRCLHHCTFPIFAQGNLTHKYRVDPQQLKFIFIK